METLEMYEPVSGLHDLIDIFEAFFAEYRVWVKLEMQVERGEEVYELVLAQFASDYDMCDAVESEANQEIALEFLFREVDERENGEPQTITMPIDPQDVEVDLLDGKVVLQSGSFTLTIERLENGSR